MSFFLQTKSRNPGPFSFKGHSEYFKASTATDKDAKPKALELGKRLKQPVEGADDQRMKFRVPCYDDDGEAKKWVVGVFLTHSSQISSTIRNR
ncbi:hypothetical protein C1J03_19245 [Sulfitobacter sp. SK012]|nr:hypothetical protein C1J03_19245 [Sulfitobacter sp. SK012]